MVMTGVNNNIRFFDEYGNKTQLAQVWETVTGDFVKNFWNELQFSPFTVFDKHTRLLNESRLEDWQPELQAEGDGLLRFLQGGDNNDNDLDSNNDTDTNNNNGNDNDDTGGSGNSDNPTSSPVAPPPPPPPQVPLPLQLIYRQTLWYGVLDPESAGRLGEPEEVLFEYPFKEGLGKYRPTIVNLTETEGLIIFNVALLSKRTRKPTSVPTITPTRKPTPMPTMAPRPSPQPPPTREIEEQNERRIIVVVVVVVVVCICVAAGYLFYLVRKEDNEHLLDGLPRDLSGDGQEYYIETRTDSAPELGAQGDNSFHRRSEENVPLNPRPAPDTATARDSITSGAGASGMPAGTITTLASTTTATSATNDNNNNNAPAPMAVIDDVLPQDDDFLGDGLGIDDDDLDGLDGLDGPSPSYDSGDVSGAQPFDLTGFQMDVQNLDDM